MLCHSANCILPVMRVFSHSLFMLVDKMNLLRIYLLVLSRSKSRCQHASLYYHPLKKKNLYSFLVPSQRQRDKAEPFLVRV